MARKSEILGLILQNRIYLFREQTMNCEIVYWELSEKNKREREMNWMIAIFEPNIAEVEKAAGSSVILSLGVH